MAEAHNIQDLPRIGHGKRAMRLQLDDGGLHLACTVTVPPPRKALRATVRYADSWRRWIYNAVFPWGWAVFLIVVALVITVVVRAESGSWWRNGWLAHAIWWIGEQFPWVPGVPLAVKVGVLAAWAAVLGAILVASVQRLLLRALLSWTGYMFLGHGQATLWSKTWAVLVKLLSGFGRPLTFSYQSVLPPLPLPPLEDTVSRYLESARAVITSPKDREALQAKADAFLTQEGPKLQRYLRLKWWTSSNYCTDWWTTYVYLHYRKALPINSSYYVLDQARRLPSTNREARAAVAIHGLLRFRRAIENETLGPVRVGGLVPWCMDQYRRAFGTTRVPGRDADSLVTYPYEDSMHVAVLCRGYIYRVETVDARTGRLLNPSKLAAAFEAVAKDAAATELADAEAEAKAEKEDARTPVVGTATGSRSRDEHQDKGAREAEVSASGAPSGHSKHKKHRGGKDKGKSSSSTGGSDDDSDADDDDEEEEGEQAMREVVTPAARAPPALRRTNTSAGRLLRRTHAYERLVPALTGWDRTSWAAAREQWFSEGVNRRSLEQVESASLFLVLSEETYGAEGETSKKKGISDSEYQKSWTMRGRSAMHGNGADRWFDKSIQIVAYGDGHLGYCAEHSWADALAVAHIIEVGSMTAEFRFGMYNPDGTICREAEKTRLWSAEGEQVFNATWKRPKLPKEQEAEMLEKDQMITIKTGRGGEHAAKGGSAGAAQSDGGVTREGTSGTDELDAGTGGAAGSRGSGGAAADDCGTRTSCLRSDGSPMFRRMQWHLPRGAERDIRSAMRHLKGLSDSVDLQVVSFSDYGKSFVKKCRVSPDAYVQAALQLAYYRDQQGRLDDTYEASVTRVFKEGRTETIRSVSEDSRRFVESMGLLEDGKLEGADDESAGVTSASAAVGAGTGGSGTTSGSGQVAWQDAVGEVDGAPIMRSDASRVSAEEGLRRLELLRSSAKRHGLITARSRAGQGVDRHLFALYVVSKGQEVESPFLAQALGTAWKLSTSQQPQQQTNMWNLKSALDARMASPGGGFGPVAPDGYGVSYMVQLEGEMFFHISSNRSAPTTDSRRFVRVLRGALLEMRQVLELGLGEGQQAKAKAGGEKKTN